MATTSYLDAVSERVVVFDGATGTWLQSQDLHADDYGGEQFEGCPEHLLVSKPSAVERVHADFLAVGCDVIETNSFGATAIVLAEYQIAHLAYELNVKAARLARRVASDFSTKDRPRWVAGSMGPGGSVFCQARSFAARRSTTCGLPAARLSTWVGSRGMSYSSTRLRSGFMSSFQSPSRMASLGLRFTGSPSIW